MTLLWFRRDLRVSDNPLLHVKGEVLPLFIFDPNILRRLEHDDRRVSFIFDQVTAFKRDLQAIGLDLALFYGEPAEVFRTLLTLKPECVVASGDYDDYALERDRKVSHLLPFHALHDNYIFKPGELLKDDGTPYLVFTPFYKRAKKIFTPEHMQEFQPTQQQLCPFAYEGLHVKGGTESFSLEALGFVRSDYDLPEVMPLLQALKAKLPHYKQERDLLYKEASSQLSVHLRFGTLGIRELLRFLLECKHEGIVTEPFFRQLVFRDFYAHMLYHFPDLAWKNYKGAFNGEENLEKFECFCSARTGVPVVDAGITQLLRTGHMHNRVRMICASFFTKDLLLPWQWGEAFFAKHLFDYDAASNVLSWQWSAGTGIDPQPYFRVFNPFLQSKKFDPEGIYIKTWLPQLDDVAPKLLHDEEKLRQSLIAQYPKPCVNHKEAAQIAMARFKT